MQEKLQRKKFLKLTINKIISVSSDKTALICTCLQDQVPTVWTVNVTFTFIKKLFELE